VSRSSAVGILSTFLRRHLPAGSYGGRSAFEALARIDRDLESGRPAVAILDECKEELGAIIRRRFEPLAADALTLKILNLFQARQHLRARSHSVRSRPIGLIVDPSNMCQLACPGCVHSNRNELLQIFDWPNGTLAEERFSALMRLYGPYAIGVYFCNYGEPLLNLQTPRFIRRAKAYLAATALSTSLSVQRFDAEEYVRSGLDVMIFSIDGATQPVYERFRRNGDLALVLSNIEKLVDAKRRLKKRTPVLSWNFLAFQHNVHEIPTAVRLARRLGVNHFRVVNPFDVTWDDPEIRPAKVAGSVRRLNFSDAGGEAENWNPFPEELDEAAIRRAFGSPRSHEADDGGLRAPGHTCHWLYKNMVMDATGRILPCCGGPRTDNNLVFGKFDGSRDVFNSEMYRRARTGFSANAVPSADAPYCSRCEWDQTTVNIGGAEIRRYFRAADAAFFDRRSLKLLADW